MYLILLLLQRNYESHTITNVTEFSGLMKKVNYDKYNPVRTITLRGKLLIAFVKLNYFFRKLSLKKQWKSVWPEHHEDPLKMTIKEKIYLGYKYYYRAMVKPEKGTNIDQYFAYQPLQIKTPGNFVAEKTITLAAGGDLMPYDWVSKQNCGELWDDVGDFFFGSDIVFANLETPADFTKPYSATPEVMLNDMYFNASEELMEIFSGNGKYKGYDVVSVANNHSLDAGVDGLINTMTYLQSKNIAYTGAARTPNELDLFPVIEREGIKIAFIAATFSLNKLQVPEDKPWLCNHIFLNEPNPDISLIVRQSELAKEKGADIVVAALHMGCAYQSYPGKTVVENIHHICDEAGIDIVIAGHPHHPQPMETYHSDKSGKDHFIAYSLGDFIAYDIFKWCHLPMMLKLHISKGMVNGQPHTCLSRLEVKPAYMHAETKRRRIVKLELIDYLKIRTDPNKYLHSEKELKKFRELQSFFETFVLLPHQQHVLV